MAERINLFSTSYCNPPPTYRHRHRQTDTDTDIDIDTDIDTDTDADTHRPNIHWAGDDGVVIMETLQCCLGCMI